MSWLDRRRLVGLSACLAVATIPLYNPSKVFSDVVTVPDVFLVLFLGFSVPALAKTRNPFGLLCRLGLVLLILAFVSAVMNYSIWGFPFDPKILLRFSEALTLAGLISANLRGGMDPKWVFRGMAVAFWLVVVMAAVQYIVGSISYVIFPWGPQGMEGVGGDFEDFRVYSLLDNPLQMLAFLMPVLGAATIRLRDRINLSHLLIWMAGLMAGFWSGAKTILIIVVAALGVIAYGKPKRILWMSATLLAAAVILVPVIISEGNNILLFRRITQPAKVQASVGQRQDVYVAGIEMALANPLLGVGPGNFAYEYPRGFRVAGSSADPATFTAENIFIQNAAELGFFGLGLYLVMFWIMLGRMSCGGEQRSVGLGLAFFLLVGLVQSVSAVPVRMVLFTLIGLSDGLNRGKPEDPEEASP